MTIQWGLNQIPNFAQAALSSYEAGSKRAREKATKAALTGYAANPSDENYRDLVALEPDTARSLREENRKETTFQKGQKFDSALGRYYGAKPSASRPQVPADENAAPVQPPVTSKSFGELQAVEPEKAAEITNFMQVADPETLKNVVRHGESKMKAAQFLMAYPQGDARAQAFRRAKSQFMALGFTEQELNAARLDDESLRRDILFGNSLVELNAARPQPNETESAYAEMLALDPKRAREVAADSRKQKLDEIKAADEAYDIAIQGLGAVSDEASYQQVIDDVSQRFGDIGIDIRSRIPATYPGDEGIRKLLQSSLAAKEQLAALDRSERIDWEQQDDEMDNARADREADSRIDTRRRGAANAERRTQITASRPPGRAAKAPKVTATNPKTGEVITLNGRGQWVDKDGKPVK